MASLLLEHHHAQEPADGTRGPGLLPSRCIGLPLREHCSPRLGAAGDDRACIVGSCSPEGAPARDRGFESFSVTHRLVPPFDLPNARYQSADHSSQTNDEDVGEHSFNQGAYSLTNPTHMSLRRYILQLTWADLVLAILIKAGYAVTLQRLYSYVGLYPVNLRGIPTWKATVRRTLKELRDKGLAVHVRRGVWQYQATDPAAATPQESAA